MEGTMISKIIKTVFNLISCQVIRIENLNIISLKRTQVHLKAHLINVSKAYFIMHFVYFREKPK